MILTPFVAVLGAELAGGSGVLAVMVCGFVMARCGSSVGAATARGQGMSFWILSTYVLYGALFVLIGIEVHVLVRELAFQDLGLGLLTGVVIWVVLVASRFVFIFATTGIIRTADRRPSQRTPLPYSWAGSRQLGRLPGGRVARGRSRGAVRSRRRISLSYA